MDLRSTPNIWFRYLLTTISPKWTINLLFRLCHHRKPDLQNPQTLDEKIQWMKLHYYQDNDLVMQCADKWRVRDYVKDNGLEHILTEVIATYHDPEEIDWDALPDKFVLKWNFGNGGNVVCMDKNSLDKAAAVRDLKRFGKLKFHLLAAEPQYDIDEKLLICEKFIEPERGKTPVDYNSTVSTGWRNMCFAALGARRVRNRLSTSSTAIGNCNVLTVREKRPPKGSQYPNPTVWINCSITQKRFLSRSRLCAPTSTWRRGMLGSAN